MKICLLIALTMPVFYGFLLDQTQVPPGGGNINNQFVSASEFLSETNALQQATDLLRHHTDKTFALLTSQLQQQLSDLGSKVHNVKDLERNNTILQSQLSALMRKFSFQESESKSLRNKTDELETENANLNRKISSLENKTQQQKQEIVDLQQLKNIQSFQDVKSLQQQIHSLTTETHALSINEQARRQDFLALYNKTDKDFSSLQRDQNMTSSQLSNSIIALTTELDMTKKAFDKKMETATEKVAITSCVKTTKTWSDGEILKFGDVVTQSGVSDIDAFKATGKFTCFVPGLYHISVYIFSYTNGALYAIYKNNNIISRVYIAQNSGSENHTGTGVVTVLLKAGYTVWIQTYEKQQQEYKNEVLRRDMENLRHDMNNMFVLLTSQLDEKLIDFEKQCLFSNNTVNTKQIEIESLEQKYTELETNHTALQNKLDFIMDKFIAQEKGIETLNTKLTGLEVLKNIQPLQDINILQHQVQTLLSSVNSLSLNEQARRQNVMALYNKTIETTKELKETIAITSCNTNGKDRSDGEIIKFHDVITEAGISNIDSFKSNGKFTCLVPGLYHISVYIFSNTNAAKYAIYKNNHIISRVYIADHSSVEEHTGTGVVTLFLQAGDSVWIQTSATMVVYGSRYSCLRL